MLLQNTSGEQTANMALQLAKAYNIVASSAGSNDPLLYAPRVWSGLHSKASQALAPLDITDREVLLHLINRIRGSQGYPELCLGRRRAEMAPVIWLTWQLASLW